MNTNKRRVVMLLESTLLEQAKVQAVKNRQKFSGYIETLIERDVKPKPAAYEKES